MLSQQKKNDALECCAQRMLCFSLVFSCWNFNIAIVLEFFPVKYCTPYTRMDEIESKKNGFVENLENPPVLERVENDIKI